MAIQTVAITLNPGTTNVEATLYGAQPPRLTTIQRDNLIDLVNTQTIFNLDHNEYNIWQEDANAWITPNSGQVKVNFSDNPADPTYWLVPLSAGSEVITNPPLPFVYSSNTDYPDNIPMAHRDDDHLIVKDPTYTARWLENEINQQPHWWRITVEYTRSNSSTDEQLRGALRNPVSGFEIGESRSLLRGNVTARTTFNLKTYADRFSLPSQGVGAGYQLVLESTVALDVRVVDVTRESIGKLNLVPFPGA